MKARTLATVAALGLGALVGGCKEPLEKWDKVLFREVDLNSDGIPDKAKIVEWNHTYYDYALETAYSNANGAHNEPKIVMRYLPYPNNMRFRDYDGDGDMDFVFNKTLKKCSGLIFVSCTRYVKEYVSRNDGHGNFAEPEYVKLIDIY